MALSQADVLAGLKEIVEEVAGIPAASIELNKNFTDDLEVDSLSMVEVVVAAEERFGIKIPDVLREPNIIVFKGDGSRKAYAKTLVLFCEALTQLVVVV
jgi:acyl carrier protein